ncbi:MAG TPA: hypothetical protein VED40_09350 [Azospirillaceae bacterium]|nr:hypothetical protein [Azospirillaceae bacterium]
MPHHRCAIVSAADDGYLPLLQGLIASIRATAAGCAVPITVLDLGIGPAGRHWLEARQVRRVMPEWDHAFRRPMPDYYKAMVSRPHLPKYVADAGTIVWLDADCWVQDWQAVELMVAGAEREGFAIAPELDRSYSPFYEGVSYATHLRAWYRACFDEATAERLGDYPLLNCGVFAARADAPHWRLWATLLARSLDQVTLFVSEQTALNVALRTSGLPCCLLPASCNWICYRALPHCSADGHRLLDPQLPHTQLGIVHLAGFPRDSKAEPRRLATPEGGWVTRPLSFMAPP